MADPELADPPSPALFELRLSVLRLTRPLRCQRAQDVSSLSDSPLRLGEAATVCGPASAGEGGATVRDGRRDGQREQGGEDQKGLEHDGDADGVEERTKRYLSKVATTCEAGKNAKKRSERTKRKM